MIYIEEKTTSKVPGETSLYIKIEYNPTYIAFLKTLSGYAYHEKTHIWEVPTIYLSRIIDELCVYDSIDFTCVLNDDLDEVAVEEPKLLGCKLTPFKYQLDGIKYGMSHNKWLLLDAPGLGKSLQIIYIANELKRLYGIQHCLIICGVNTLKNNWVKEIKKSSSLSSVILGERTTRTGNKVIGSIADRVAHLRNPIEEFFVITNIETFRNDDIINAIRKGPNKFDLLVIDEIHRMADINAQQSRGVMKLKDTSYIIGATGTLITNTPLNAYAPLKLIGAERGNFTNYKQFYCEFSGPFNNIVSGYKNISVLKDVIDKHSLRRTKDILELPPKTIIDEYVEMENPQYKFYNEIKKGIKESVDKVTLNTTSILALLARLRQATACPSILTTENIRSAKIDRAVDLAEQIISNGDKVVIFSTFKETVNVLSNLLDRYNPLIGTGDIKDSIISENIDIFQSDPNRKLFIGTWQKMGTGNTMNAARYMIFIDTPYTSAQYEQACDRIYRIGSTQPVFIYNLIATNTVDERVREIIDSKEALSDYLIDGELSERSLNILMRYITDSL